MIRAAAVLAAALTSAACSATRQEAGQVDHVVLLWLKAPGDRSALTRVEQTVRGFDDQLPEPTSVTLGAPLLDDPHVQNDYDAAFVFNFADRAALAAYVEDPTQQRALRALLAPHAARVQIYDVLLR